MERTTVNWRLAKQYRWRRQRETLGWLLLFCWDRILPAFGLLALCGLALWCFASCTGRA